MKLSEFEGHGLWPRLRELQEWMTQIREEDDGRNIDAIDELDTRLAQLQASFRARRRLAPLLVPSQLEAVDGSVSNFWSAISTAQSVSDMRQRAQYLQQAITYAQQATAAQGAWPNPNPTAAEERLEVAVVDLLLARAGEVDEYVRERIASIEGEVADADDRASQVAAAIVGAEQELTKLVADARAAVEAERNRIATVIDEGNAKIASFESILDASLATWEKERNEQFEARVESLRDAQSALLEDARKEYERLTTTIEDYQALVQSDSADRLAKHYEDEAGSAKASGWKATIGGFILLVLGAAPLLLVVLQPVLTAAFRWEFEPADWTSLAARAGVAAVFVGAATVAIRIGNGFLKRSADYKRLAMELRTMGPFLSAVEDRESVDQARLDLVGRAFGQAYVPQKEDRPDDAVPVSVLQQLLALLTRTVSK